MMLRHTDLCSGIGGFSLGFQWAGLSEPVLFCEIDPWCRKVLAKHWPDVLIAEDVEELANDPNGLVPDCDILTAGYPCQPFSLAGERRGTEDDRHIWPYIFTIIQRKRPSWCVFENVYGHVSMGLGEVLSDLEGQGYAARPFIVPACAVDAPHRRDRLWIVGHTGCLTKGQSCGGFSQEQFNSKTQGQWSVEGHRFADTGKDVADTDSARREEQRWGKPAQAQHQAPESGSQWKPEPSVGRVAHGIPRRVDRLKGLGNAIVPQIVMRIGQTIKAVNSCNTE